MFHLSFDLHTYIICILTSEITQIYKNTTVVLPKMVNIQAWVFKIHTSHLQINWRHFIYMHVEDTAMKTAHCITAVMQNSPAAF